MPVETYTAYESCTTAVVRLRNGLLETSTHLWERPVLFWVLVALILSGEYWCAGPYSFLRIHDNADSFVPRAIAAKQSLHCAGPSYWWPFMAGGLDRLSQDFSYTQLTTLLFLLLPNWTAYTLVIIAQFLLSGYGTCLLCTDVLQLSRLAATFAGVASSLFVGGLLYMQFGLASFPLVIWALVVVSQNAKPGRRALLISLAGLAYGVTTSLTITLPFALALLILWFLFVTPSTKPRFWALLAVFEIAAVLPHAKTIWALLCNAADSHRANRVFEDIRSVMSTLSSGPSHAIWIFALWAIVFGPLIIRDRRKRYFSLVGLYLFCAFGFVGLNLLKFLASSRLAFGNGFQIDRFYEFAPFFGALATATVIESCLETQISGTANYRRFVWQAAVASLVIFAAATKYDHLKILVSQGNGVYNFESGRIRQLRHGKPHTLADLWRVATVGDETLHPAYMNTYGLETIDGYPNLYSRRFQLFWGNVIDPAVARDRRLWHYFFDWGNRIYLFGSGRKISHFADIARPNLLSLANTKYIISRVPVESSQLECISAPPQPPTTRFAAALRSGLTSGRKDIYVYLNRDWLPRAFVAGNVASFSTLASLNRALAQSDSATLKSTVFLEDSFQSAIVSGIEPGPSHLELLEYSADTLKLFCATTRPAVVVVSNTYSRFWRCRVDGIQRPIVPAYGTFWAISVRPGEHTISFEYRPPYSIL